VGRGRSDTIPTEENITQQDANEILDDAYLQAEAMREAAWAGSLHEAREGRAHLSRIRGELVLPRVALRSELQEIVNTYQ